MYKNHFKFQEAYNNLSRELKVTHLLGNIQNGQQSEEARQMAAVLLRRLFTTEFFDFYKGVGIKPRRESPSEHLSNITSFAASS